MPPFTTLLAATDFSMDGNNAVRRAVMLAQAHGARLHLLHVLDPSGCKPLRDWFSPTIDIDLKAAQARAALRRVAVDIAAACDVPTTIEVRVGDVLTTLMARSEHADLVVLGQRGHGRLETLRVGRTTDRMLRTSRRPVLVVKKAATAPYRRALMPIDFTPSSELAIRFAARALRGAPWHVFHAADAQHESMLRRSDVDEDVIRNFQHREEAALVARMRHTVARLGLDGASMAFSVGRGPAASATLKRAKAVGADVLVAGKQGRSALGGFLLGSVSQQIVATSECDVLIVPRPRRRPEPLGAAAATTEREGQRAAGRRQSAC